MKNDVVTCLEAPALKEAIQEIYNMLFEFKLTMDVIKNEYIYNNHSINCNLCFLYGN